MSDLLRGLPPLLAQHLELALVALVIAAAISLPLAIVVAPRQRAAVVVVTAASVIQTVPSLALLALMVPVLAASGLLSPFGFPPAVIALTLYAVLPILRNAVTGLRGVDPATIEAARGMGFSNAQLLTRVQLPLAAPVIAAGIRTATVWTVGAATLATPIGQACLGNYIFTGLQTRNFAMLLVGVAAAAGLAIVLDGLLAAVEGALAGRQRGPARRTRLLVPLGLLVALVVGVIGVLPRVTAGGGHHVVAAVAKPQAGAVTRVRIGGKTFTEQYILIALLQQELEQAGLQVEVVQSLGSTVIFDALAHGDLDVYVEYSGTLWTNVMKRAAGTPRWQLTAELDGWLANERGVRSLGPLGFENTYALATTRAMAERLHLKTLADLPAHASSLSLGADYEFLGRAEWASVKSTYGFDFGRTATFDPSLLYEAVQRGDVDFISAFSSDGRIAAYDLAVLADPAGALPPYDAMILLGPKVANDARVVAALSSLHISVEAMRAANAMVDKDHATPDAAARWLLQQH